MPRKKQVKAVVEEAKETKNADILNEEPTLQTTFLHYLQQVIRKLKSFHSLQIDKNRLYAIIKDPLFVKKKKNFYEASENYSVDLVDDQICIYPYKFDYNYISPQTSKILHKFAKIRSAYIIYHRLYYLVTIGPEEYGSVLPIEKKLPYLESTIKKSQQDVAQTLLQRWLDFYEISTDYYKRRLPLFENILKNKNVFESDVKNYDIPRARYSDFENLMKKVYLKGISDKASPSINDIARVATCIRFYTGKKKGVRNKGCENITEAQILDVTFEMINTAFYTLPKNVQQQRVSRTWVINFMKRNGYSTRGSNISITVNTLHIF